MGNKNSDQPRQDKKSYGDLYGKATTDPPPPKRKPRKDNPDQQQNPDSSPQQ